MAKIGRETALKTFALDPEADPNDRNSTGLIWKAQNKHPRAKTKPGDKVYFGERSERGYIPLSSIRKIMKEHAQENRKPASKIAADAIAAMRRGEPVDLKAKAIEMIKRRFVEEDGKIYWVRDYFSAVAGAELASPVVMIGRRPFHKEDLVKALTGVDFELPEKVTPEEYREIRTEARRAEAAARDLGKERMSRLDYRAAQMRGDIEPTPATAFDEMEAYMLNCEIDIASNRKEIAELKAKMALLLTRIP